MSMAGNLPLSGTSSDRAVGGGRKVLRLGGPIFEAEPDPEKLALLHRRLGYRAAYCPEVQLGDRERIRAIREAFARHDVIVAEVGRWVNLMDADPVKRKEHLQMLIDGLALADEIDARCAVTIAGSRNPGVWYGPDPGNVSKDFFDLAVENARKIIDAVKPKRAVFTYEAMGWSLPDTVEGYLDLIRAIDRPGFGVHLDPCNLINSPRLYYRSGALIEECFQKLGRWIASCHAKDLDWVVEMNVHFAEVRPGLGSIDYRTYLRQLASLDRDVPLMTEHLPNAEEYQKAAQYIQEVGRSIGLHFE